MKYQALAESCQTHLPGLHASHSRNIAWKTTHPKKKASSAPFCHGTLKICQISKVLVLTVTGALAMRLRASTKSPQSASPSHSSTLPTLQRSSYASDNHVKPCTYKAAVKGRAAEVLLLAQAESSSHFWACHRTSSSGKGCSDWLSAPPQESNDSQRNPPDMASSRRTEEGPWAHCRWSYGTLDSVLSAQPHS
jgi:hypothetical protein